MRDAMPGLDLSVGNSIEAGFLGFINWHVKDGFWLSHFRF